MSAPSDMNCERAHELLVDLSCNELAPALTAEVRAHVARCEKCGPELARFSRVMTTAGAIPLAEPSPGVEDRILRAAREALAARGGGTEAHEPSRQISGYRAWFARISEWALSPQVAMASVLVLMVGIGLYALPLGREPESVAFEATPEERETAEPAASATATAVEQSEARGVEARGSAREQNEGREQDSADKKAERAKSSPEAFPLSSERRASGGKRLEGVREQGKKPGSYADELSGRSTPSAQMAPRKNRAASGSKVDGLADDDVAGALEYKGGGGSAASQAKPSTRKEPPSSKAANAPIAPAEPRVREQEGAAPSADVRSRSAQPFAPPPGSVEAPKSEMAPSGAGAGYAAPEAARAPGAAPADVAREEPKTTKDWAQSALSEGISAARRGAYAQAISLLEPVVQKGPASARPSASLWLARSYRGQGDCSSALRYYATLVKAPNTPNTVLEEAADCYERVGNRTQAGELRNRLKTE